ncbi:hypothetical protein SALBM135S_03072 [Streptomyces alboniger]
MPDDQADGFDNGFKAQWELFLKHVYADAPYRWDLLAGARGVQLAELGREVLGRGPPHRRTGDRAVSTVLLPVAGGGTRAYTPRAEPSPVTAGGPPPTSRTVFSAAHVVADPFADVSPDGPAAVDWDATLAFRRHLWSHGLGVAEAMDTAQRGMGLDWASAAELIRRSAAEARAVGGRVACGVGTDQLTSPAELPRVVEAYEEHSRLSRRRAPRRS